MELYEDPPRRTSVGKSDELRVGPCVSLSVCSYRVKRSKKETTPYTRHKSLLVVIGRKAKSLPTHRRRRGRGSGCIVGRGRSCGCIVGRCPSRRWVVVVLVDACWVVLVDVSLVVVVDASWVSFCGEYFKA